MIEKWLDVFKSKGINHVKTVIILGSGLDVSESYFDQTIELPFDLFEGLPKPTVSGHSATFIVGLKNKTATLIQKGRVHFYEGFSMHDLTLNVELFKALGATQIIITNACGGMNKSLSPGDFVILSDFINFMPSNPLVGHLGSPTFPDMTEPFDSGLRALMKRVFENHQAPYLEGTYVSFMGPYYETKAEIKMLSQFGHVVGMSTVPETIKARSLGMKVLGFSVVTNMATGIQERLHDHHHVLEIAKKKAPLFQALIQSFLDQL
jgi:purine-nucleoside phosphorylase